MKINKIGLRSALAMLQTAYICGKLNTFSIEYYKVNGEYSSKELACRADLKNAEKWRDTSDDIQIEAPEQRKKMGYSVWQKRVLRLYDLKNGHNFSLKIDLITGFEHDNVKFIIDHLSD